MHVERHTWKSPCTSARMRSIQYGDRGAPVVYLPSSGGDESEFEKYDMASTLAPRIDAGELHVYSIDGRGPQGLFDPSLEPRERIRSYAAVERYVAAEMLPWVSDRAGIERIILIGSSYGAFLAANLLFKQPDRVEIACGLGGVYEMWHRLDGYHDDDVYFHTPFEYLPRLEDPEILNAIRATRGIEMYAAADDEWLSQTHRLEQVLREKRLPHRSDVWPSPANHHESWWRRQLAQFIDRAV